MFNNFKDNTDMQLKRLESLALTNTCVFSRSTSMTLKVKMTISTNEAMENLTNMKYSKVALIRSVQNVTFRRMEKAIKEIEGSEVLEVGIGYRSKSLMNIFNAISSGKKDDNVSHGKKQYLLVFLLNTFIFSKVIPKFLNCFLL